MCTARPWGPGLEPGTYRMLGESPQLWSLFRQVSLFLISTTCSDLNNMTWGDFVTNITMQNAGIQHLCASVVAERIYFQIKQLLQTSFGNSTC